MHVDCCANYRRRSIYGMLAIVLAIFGVLVPEEIK